MSDASRRPGRRPYPPPSRGERSPGRPRAPRPARSARTLGFALTSAGSGDGDRLALAGEFTMATTGLLDAELASLYGSGPAAGDLVLDLTAITFLDVMGVMALRRALDQVQPAGRLRLGLPVANGPRRLLSVAVDLGWLPPVFGPGPLTF